MKKIYHISNYPHTVYKYGLLSPRAMYDEHPDLFGKIVFHTYKDRTSRYLNKAIEDLKNEDILDYLDNSPTRRDFTSECLFFSFIKKSDMPYVNIKNSYIEFEFDLEDLKKHLIDDKVILTGLKKWKPIRFDELIERYEEFRSLALEGAKIKPTTMLHYQKIVHFGLHVYKVYSEMI